MAKLKTKCCIRGSQQGPKGEVERQRCIDDFNADKEHVIVCNIKAGGVGVSLHGTPTSRMRMSIICVTDSAQDAKQALGRVWRAKGAKSIQKFFFAAGTIEESDIMPNMRSKIDRIDTLNDGDLRFRAERPMPLSDDDIPMEYVKSI
jgi:SNF2 family DNA or RNA helicase